MKANNELVYYADSRMPAPSCPTILKKRFLLQDTFADKISHSQEPECDYPSVIMGIPIRNTYVTVDLYAYPSLSYII
jgi:hypothetical protein